MKKIKFIGTNAEFAKNDKNFRDACEKAGIEPTARQAGKWLRKCGLAWKMRNKEKKN